MSATTQPPSLPRARRQLREAMDASDFYRGWRIEAHGCSIYFADEFEARAALKACRESFKLAQSIIARLERQIEGGS